MSDFLTTLDITLERVEHTGLLTNDGITVRDTVHYHKVLTVPAHRLPELQTIIARLESFDAPGGSDSVVRQDARQRAGRRRGRGRGRRPSGTDNARREVGTAGTDA